MKWPFGGMDNSLEDRHEKPSPHVTIAQTLPDLELHICRMSSKLPTAAIVLSYYIIDTIREINYSEEVKNAGVDTELTLLNTCTDYLPNLLNSYTKNELNFRHTQQEKNDYEEKLVKNLSEMSYNIKSILVTLQNNDVNTLNAQLAFVENRFGGMGGGKLDY